MSDARSSSYARLYTLALLTMLVLLPIAQNAQAQKLKVLYKFTGGADGGGPQGTLLLRGGKLYGTATNGGNQTFPDGDGTIFAVDLSSGQESTIYTFTGGPSDGADPAAGIFMDSSGNLLGTTLAGGANNQGTVFELSSGSMRLLHSFDGADGSEPWGNVVEDSSGVLYSTTYKGGTANTGTAFKLVNGSLSTLFTFSPSSGIGSYPYYSGVRLQHDYLYGTTRGSGKGLKGTVFRVNTATGEAQHLYHFTGGSDGGAPTGGVISDGMGNLYGVAAIGGSRPGGLGSGVVFKISLATHKETVLHAFSGPDGKQPAGGLVRDSQGNLYGVTSLGGAHHAGTIFKLDNANNLTVLHSFVGGVGAGHPQSGLTMGVTGNLYGTTQSGDTSCKCGTVFVLVP